MNIHTMGILNPPSVKLITHLNLTIYDIQSQQINSSTDKAFKLKSFYFKGNICVSKKSLNKLTKDFF